MLFVTRVSLTFILDFCDIIIIILLKFQWCILGTIWILYSFSDPISNEHAYHVCFSIVTVGASVCFSSTPRSNVWHSTDGHSAHRQLARCDQSVAKVAGFVCWYSNDRLHCWSTLDNSASRTACSSVSELESKAKLVSESQSLCANRMSTTQLLH